MSLLEFLAEEKIYNEEKKARESGETLDKGDETIRSRTRRAGDVGQKTFAVEVRALISNSEWEA